MSKTKMKSRCICTDPKPKAKGDKYNTIFCEGCYEVISYDDTYKKPSEKPKEEKPKKKEEDMKVEMVEEIDQLSMFNDIEPTKVLKEKRDMADYFIVPPFSVLDTRLDRWAKRRRWWLKKTGNLSETKENVLGEGMMGSINEGSSNFDPVLAEIIYRWFNTEGGAILDPFGGEQTKGVVCGELGFEYHAVEFRKEQVDFNNMVCSEYNNVKYYHGDSNNIDTIIGDTMQFDFCFTSPPYYDLEVYSKEDMSALGTYEEFMAQYKNIFARCFKMLKNNRFLAVKICEIRDKKTGNYRNFVGDNITIMKEIGFKYYNEIILINSVGTLPMRAGQSMNSSRKVGKHHQNVLVFYKGDLNVIGNVVHEIIPKNEYYEQ